MRNLKAAAVVFVLSLSATGVVYAVATQKVQKEANTGLTDHAELTAAKDIASIPANTCTDSSTISVPNAGVSDPCAVGTGATFEAGLVAMCYATADDTVVVRVCNVTVGAVDPASQSYSVRVWTQ